MARIAETVKRVLRRFRVARILSMRELMTSLECSRSTVQRRLKTWGCLSSYNCNGAYYALPDVVSFDSRGMWRFGEARFSRYGNLTSTVAGVIGDSDCGLSAAELGEALGVNAHSFISRFASHPRLARERLGGRHVYFCSDPEVGKRQRSARRRAEARTGPALPSDAEAVSIFAEMIRHPDRDAESVARQLQAQGVDIEPCRIRRLLERHGLGSEKKTGDLESRLR